MISTGIFTLTYRHSVMRALVGTVMGPPVCCVIPIGSKVELSSVIALICHIFGSSGSTCFFRETWLPTVMPATSHMYLKLCACSKDGIRAEAEVGGAPALAEAEGRRSVDKRLALSVNFDTSSKNAFRIMFK